MRPGIDESTQSRPTSVEHQFWVSGSLASLPKSTTNSLGDFRLVLLAPITESSRSDSLRSRLI